MISEKGVTNENKDGDGCVVFDRFVKGYIVNQVKEELRSYLRERIRLNSISSELIEEVYGGGSPDPYRMIDYEKVDLGEEILWAKNSRLAELLMKLGDRDKYIIAAMMRGDSIPEISEALNVETRSASCYKSRLLRALREEFGGNANE